MKKTIFTLIIFFGLHAFSFWGPSNAEDLCKGIKNRDKKNICLEGIKKPGFKQLSKRRLSLCDKAQGRKNDDLTVNCVIGEFHPELIDLCETAAHNDNLGFLQKCINTFVGYPNVDLGSSNECGTGATIRLSIDQRYECYKGIVEQKPRTVEPPAPVGQQ